MNPSLSQQPGRGQQQSSMMSPYSRMFLSILRQLDGMPSRRRLATTSGYNEFENWLQQPQFQRQRAPTAQLTNVLTGGTGGSYPL